MTIETIHNFAEPYYFLSNFHLSPLSYEGLLYPSLEHAYQAAKTLNRSTRRLFTRATLSPGGAKQMGRRLHLRHDWERVKLTVMLDLLRIKFAPGTPLADKLLATGNALLVEGNYWGDCYWGVCRGRGRNRLGQLLMRVRGELRSAPEPDPEPTVIPFGAHVAVISNGPSWRVVCDGRLIAAFTSQDRACHVAEALSLNFES